MNVNERRVYFALDGDDFDPDEVTKFIGIEPTSVMRKGSKAGGKSPKVSSWTISTENVIDEYIDVLGMATEIYLCQSRKLEGRQSTFFGP